MCLFIYLSTERHSLSIIVLSFFPFTLCFFFRRRNGRRLPLWLRTCVLGKKNHFT